MQELMLSRNNKCNHGFTLIEVLVAIVILMVGLLGMFQSINLALDKNLENQYRQNAVSIGEKMLGDQKAMKFDNITGRNVRTVETVASNSVFKNFSVEHHVTNLSVSDVKSKQISVMVWWRYRGRNYEHQTASGVGSIDLTSGN